MRGAALLAAALLLCGASFAAAEAPAAEAVVRAARWRAFDSSSSRVRRCGEASKR